MTSSPFSSKRVGRSSGPDPVDAEVIEDRPPVAAGPSTTWQVRLVGAPDTLPYGTVVTIQSGEAAPAPGAKDQRRVSLAGMVATVAQGIRVFTGALLPQLSIAVTPQRDINAGDILRRTLVATDFTTLPSGVREAVVPWSSLSGHPVINVPDPRLVPEPVREQDSPYALPVLVGGVALLGYAAWRIFLPSPRSNPGPCCAACARGLKCSGKRKSR